jgi:hypothetical protein
MYRALHIPSMHNLTQYIPYSLTALVMKVSNSKSGLLFPKAEIEASK